MRLALIASLILVTAGRATAQPGTVAPLPAVPSTASSPVAPAPPAHAPAPAPPASDGELSADTAVTLSVGGTLASWTALLIAGSIDHSDNLGVPLAGIAVVLAPSFGHWYAGTPFTGWFGLRAAALVPVMIAATSCGECDPPSSLGWIALALYAVGTIGDIATAPADVRRHNEERRTLHDLAVVPMLQRGAGGIVLGGRF
jgi:hypothetical protein